MTKSKIETKLTLNKINISELNQNNLISIKGGDSKRGVAHGMAHGKR